MFAIVAVNFETFQALPPFEFKLMTAMLRYVNRCGECHPALRQLADDVLASEATVSRAMTRLEERGCFKRERQGNGRYLYRVAQRFLRHRIETRATKKTPIGAVKRINASIEAVSAADSHLAAVQDGLSQRARQEVAPSSDQRSSEGEQQPSQQDEIPTEWEAAAAAERRLAGLGEVNLRAEWRKLVAYSEGARITIWRWRGWVLKARGDRAAEGSTRSPDVTAWPNGSKLEPLPGDERQQRQARDWVRSGFWLRSGAWGPAPDQPGCSLSPDLVAWCLRERAALAAA